MRKFLALCLALLLSVCCFAGCESILQPQYSPAVDLSTPFIGFRAEKPEEADLEGYDRVELEQLMAYEPAYGGYGVTVYYDTLTPEEQAVYRAFQYALDHTQSCIFIDSRIMENDAQRFLDILYYMSLDNPLLEQNLSWNSWSVEITIPNINPLSSAPAQELTGSILEVQEFGPEKLERKKQAIAVAQQILADLPATASDKEKAEYFYRYLGEHVQYQSDETWSEETDYLYDALCVGKTNCDGYANAYSLLCYMAGIPCMEKQYTPEDDEEIGHTWNAVYLDGGWYNVDATGSEEVQGKYPTLMYFGFSDALLEYQVDYEQKLPKSEKDLIPPDVTVTKTSKAGSQVSSAWKTVKKTGRKYVVVCFTGGEPKKSVLQKIANSLRKDITYVSKITRTGEAVYYIYPK